jgi:hypothetical protein
MQKALKCEGNHSPSSPITEHKIIVLPQRAGLGERLILRYRRPHNGHVGRIRICPQSEHKGLGNGLAQLTHQRQFAWTVVIDLGRVDHGAALHTLGHIHGHIGAAQQRRHLVAIGGGESDANAAADKEAQEY